MSEYEQERVPCEECGQQDAVCTVAVMMGKQVIHRKLCQACMAKTSMSIASGNIGQVLGALINAARNAAQAAVQKQDSPETEAPSEEASVQAEPLDIADGDAVCRQCGMTLGEYRKLKRMRCAACCTAFRSALTEMFRKSCPAAQHVGRRPLNTREAQLGRARREALQRQMAEAGAREDCETAARCRDALRSVNAQEGTADA